MAKPMLELRAEAALLQNASGGPIDLSRRDPGLNRLKRGLPGLHDGFPHPHLFLRRLACCVDPGDVGPVAVAAGIGVNHHEMAGLHFSLASAGICSRCGGGVGAGHAVNESIAALHLSGQRVAFERHLKKTGDLRFT